jgi:hypothetical protein
MSIPFTCTDVHPIRWAQNLDLVPQRAERWGNYRDLNLEPLTAPLELFVNFRESVLASYGVTEEETVTVAVSKEKCHLFVD